MNINELRLCWFDCICAKRIGLNLLWIFQNFNASVNADPTFTSAHLNLGAVYHLLVRIAVGDKPAHYVWF